MRLECSSQSIPRSGFARTVQPYPKGAPPRSSQTQQHHILCIQHPEHRLQFQRDARPRRQPAPCAVAPQGRDCGRGRIPLQPPDRSTPPTPERCQTPHQPAGTPETQHPAGRKRGQPPPQQQGQSACKPQAQQEPQLKNRTPHRIGHRWGVAHRVDRNQARLNTRVPLVPPKPKLFFTATSIFRSRAVLAQ